MELILRDDVDKLGRRVRKHKERVRDHRAPDAQKHRLAVAL